MNAAAALLAAALAGASCGVAYAQNRNADPARDYPNKPIRWIVTFAAGGPTDFVARTIGAKLNEAFGQSVIIDVRAGASGIIGTEIVAKATPDGYTLLYGTSTTMTLLPAQRKNIPYDPMKDFAPVTLLVRIPQILIANNSVPVQSVKELIAYAKAKPGQLNYGSGGEGSTPFFGMELFKGMTGTDIVHIPYKGLAPALTDLIGGQLMLLFHTAQPAVLQMIKAGRIKGLAVSSAKRTPAAPELPTVAEGGVPGFENVAWHALYAPAKTPAGIIAKLNTQVTKILRDPDVKQRLASQAAVPSPGTPESLRQFMAEDAERATRVMRRAGLTRQSDK